MTTTPELDRAIDASVLKTYGAEFKTNVDDHDRAYAQTLIAELLLGMDDDAKELWLIRPDMGAGFVAALAEIKRRAGIVEGEGINI